MVPANKRPSLRIALRKPLSVLLLFVSVMSFNVCVFLGQSLNISSVKIFNAQTTGHNYEYQIQYQDYKTDGISNNAMKYIDSASTVTVNSRELERTVTGLYSINALYELKNKDNKLLTTPNRGCVYINPELSEIYRVKPGDRLFVTIAGKPYKFTVKEIAVNAQTNHIYINGDQLAEILSITAGSYNGMFSADKPENGFVTDKARRIEELNRNSVSNKTSAVINQVTGVLVGIILIFLALHISFQDNTHDILILSMLGQDTKYIRKLFVNIYLPVLWTAFAITFVPGIISAKAIQKSLSISTNDYMPFGINLFVILIAFGLINLIYYGVQAVFSFRIRKIIKKETYTEIIYAE